MKRQQKGLFSLKKGLKKLKRRLKDSIDNPPLYLGMVAIFLFAVVCLASGSLAESSGKNNGFSTAALLQSFEKPLEKEVFAGLDKKTWSESPDYLLIANSSLKAITPPSSISPQVLGALIGDVDVSEENEKTILEYSVEPGDSLWSIADKFKISIDTILWANDLGKNSVLKEGQRLVILPVSGVLYHVKSGDTISKIVQTYKGKMESIIAFNNLSSEGDIYVGDMLVIPNGQMPKTTYPSSPSVPLADSYFICPINSCRITQGLHFYNAIDFSNGKCGEIIYAAAAGEVLRVNMTSSTYRLANNGYGSYMTILHPNGAVTYYGHIAANLVSPGEKVSQGQAIALMGGKPGTPGAGRSTGCHVHFGVSGTRNPFAR